MYIFLQPHFETPLLISWYVHLLCFNITSIVLEETFIAHRLCLYDITVLMKPLFNIRAEGSYEFYAILQMSWPSLWLFVITWAFLRETQTGLTFKVPCLGCMVWGKSGNIWWQSWILLSRYYWDISQNQNMTKSGPKQGLNGAKLGKIMTKTNIFHILKLLFICVHLFCAALVWRFLSLMPLS